MWEGLTDLQIHTTCLEQWILTRPVRDEAKRDDTPEGRLSTLRDSKTRACFAYHVRVTDADGRMTCEICHRSVHLLLASCFAFAVSRLALCFYCSDYRVNIDYTFDFAWVRCCTWTSVGHCCELVICVILLIMYVRQLSPKHTQPFGPYRAESFL